MFIMETTTTTTATASDVVVAIRIVIAIYLATSGRKPLPLMEAIMIIITLSFSSCQSSELDIINGKRWFESWF